MCTSAATRSAAHCTAGYVVVTDEAAGRTIPNAFLDKVKDEFLTKYAEKGKTVKELGLSSFGWVLLAYQAGCSNSCGCK